jgi:glycosyltransferase involved in cell wall biosynthesis
MSTTKEFNVRVSALIPTYNRRTHVERAIESALAQTHPVDEVIVVDDGSTDGTAQMIELRYGARVRVIRQQNTGVSGARRRAVREARCEWIAFLDSDDEWTQDRNRKLLEAVALVPTEVAWIFGDVSVIRDGAEPVSLFHRHGLASPGKMRVFDDTWSVHHPFQFGLLQASLIRREALLEIDCFSDGLTHSEDFLVGVQVACRYKLAAISAEVTRLYRTSDLVASSADRAGRGSPDYFRARVRAYALIARTDSRAQWRESHAHAVRGLCKTLADKGERIGTLAGQQFHLGFSAKSVVFLSAALFGRTGMRAWARLVSAFRRERDVEEHNYAL